MHFRVKRYFTFYQKDKSPNAMVDLVLYTQTIDALNIGYCQITTLKIIKFSMYVIALTSEF